MAFCLPKEFTEKFVKTLKEGKIVPEELIAMSSEQRRTFLKDIVGEENVREVNALLESKIILKDQKRGMVTWAKKVSGISEAARRDLISKIERMDKILDPVDARAFLEDLAAKRLGTEVTFEEAQKITELSKKVGALEQISKETGTKFDRTEWGLAQLELADYVESLIPQSKDIVANVLNIPKTSMTTLDLSAVLRQGWGMMSRPQFYKTLGSMFRYAFSEKAFREMQADVISRPSYPIMKASGLRITALADKITKREEAYMTTLLSRIPGIRASERAYVGFLTKLRADVFDYLIESARLRGEGISAGSKATVDIANVVNDFTGSGNIGKGDKYANAVPLLNATLFSPRKISATVNMLNPVRYVDPRISPTARRAALRQLIGSTAMTVGVIMLLKAAGAAVETDSTSSDFMKAKFGKTRYDFSGGNLTYAVLLSRLFQNKTKSSTSGKVTELGKGYKPTTRADLIVKFSRNKLSPIASFVADWMYGSDAIGEPFSVGKDLLERAYPLIIQDIRTIIKEDPSNTIASILATMFGVSIQSY